MVVCFCFEGGGRGLRNEVLPEAKPVRHEQRAKISGSTYFLIARQLLRNAALLSANCHIPPL